MTLEQIKNRQEQINGLLYTLLQDTAVVVEKIVGVQNEQKTDDSIVYPTSGLLEEISYSQNITESYISKIATYNRLLCNGTFTPVVETECAQIKVY